MTIHDNDDTDSPSQPLDPADPNWDTYAAATTRLAALERARQAKRDTSPAARHKAAQQAQRIAQIKRVIAARKKAGQYQADQGMLDTSSIVRSSATHPAPAGSNADLFATGQTDDFTSVDQLEDLLRELKQADPALYETLDIESLNDTDAEAIMRGFGGPPDSETGDGSPESFDTLRGKPRAAASPTRARSAWDTTPKATPDPSRSPTAQRSNTDDLSDKSNTGRLLSLLLGGGFVLVFFIVGGYLLDQGLHTSPVFTLIGVGIGIFTLFAIFYAMYRVLAQPTR